MSEPTNPDHPTESAPAVPEQSENEIRAQRLRNMERLKELGYDTPFGHAFPNDGNLDQIAETFEAEKPVRIAGRLVAKREMGKSIFAHLQDSTGRFQIYLKKDIVGEAAFDAFKVVDIGDTIGGEGTLFLTRTEEKTANLTSWHLLSKALLPLPEKHAGLTDVETRYRKRYLDLIANEEVREVFTRRLHIVREMRSYLQERGFLEVETPMMQLRAGGAAAKPFVTHYNALGTDMSMRIAPELFLKRLLVGGYNKVFELNKNFRNEGLSRNHQPEFTMLEIYEAYGDRETMAELVQGLILYVADTVIGSRQVGTESHPVNLDNFRTVPYKDLLRETAGDDYFDLDLAGQRAKAVELGCHVDDDMDATDIGQEIFEKCIEGTLLDPTFVIRLPYKLVPLAKRCTDDPELVDVYELIIGGKEISPGYTELNDPIDQRARFEEQAGGDPEKIDEEFLNALEHGMPPAGGLGLGVDRLVMLLTGCDAIRDVIFFPQLKAKG